MRVDWCVSSWFRIKNTHSLTHNVQRCRVSAKKNFSDESPCLGTQHRFRRQQTASG